jgi:hypothetical protein
VDQAPRGVDGAVTFAPSRPTRQGPKQVGKGCAGSQLRTGGGVYFDHPFGRGLDGALGKQHRHIAATRPQREQVAIVRAGRIARLAGVLMITELSQAPTSITILTEAPAMTSKSAGE